MEHRLMQTRQPWQYAPAPWPLFLPGKTVACIDNTVSTPGIYSQGYLVYDRAETSGTSDRSLACYSAGGRTLGTDCKSFIIHSRTFES